MLNIRVIRCIDQPARIINAFTSLQLHYQLSIYANNLILIVRKRAKIRNRYNQAPHLTQDTNEKVTTSQLEITNESQEASPFPAGDQKASTNRRA